MDRAATKIEELQQEILALMTAEEEQERRRKEELENKRKEEIIQAQKRIKEKEEADAKERKRIEDERNQPPKSFSPSSSYTVHVTQDIIPNQNNPKIPPALTFSTKGLHLVQENEKQQTPNNLQSPQANSPQFKASSNISGSPTTNNNQEIDLNATIEHQNLNQQENATKFPPGYKSTSDVQIADNPITTGEFINTFVPPIPQVKQSVFKLTSDMNLPPPSGQLKQETSDLTQQDNSTLNNNQPELTKVQSQVKRKSKSPPQIDSESGQSNQSRDAHSPPSNGNNQIIEVNTKQQSQLQSSVKSTSKLPLPQSFGVSRRDSLKKK
ncbi:MAG: hypothetical protein EZS28_034443 [Streblomastix strix]|uniref:Uncharacterized protein n=1 Tax=Streblomastix strix TaxID=222440 RepID=A0A5J4UJ68_9EUKA|nr:MAG: hypothetical protein EZS28_034443 [Streblomastix strix]